MRIAWLDCFSGISGDMLLGALADAGAPQAELSAIPGKLGLSHVRLEFERVERSDIGATKAHVKFEPGHHHRSLSAILKIIEGASLSERTRTDAARVFRRLGEAEAEIHGIPVEKVHFHEVGAEDSIVDIVAGCAGLEMLGIERLICSPLDVGSGSVETAHGRLPVPAPATAKLLAAAPVYSSGLEAELVTPTGAAMVATLAAGFGPLPPMTLDATGYGAGSKEFKGRPNVLRLLVGHTTAATVTEMITVLEANLDDMNPQVAGFVAEKALAEGALDCFYTSVQMKKGRPGLLLTVLAAPGHEDRLTQLLFEETSTIGVRSYRTERRTLERSHVTVDTSYGQVRVKVASRSGEVLNFAPEYEDCKRLAAEKHIPLKRILEAASAAYLAKNHAR
jgi:hypothetical protein